MESNKLPMQDVIGIFFTTVVLPIGFIFETTFVLSFWFNIFSKEWTLRVVSLFFIGINAYLNIFQMVRVGPNGIKSSTTLPFILKSGFKFCHICNINSPPRSYHCPICNICIYRRDHHCSFVGKCVGHFNQIFFVGAIISLWIISLTCCIWNWNMLWFIAFPNLKIGQLWHLMLPHIAYLFKLISFFEMFAVLIFMCSIVTFMFLNYLITAQFFCIWRGQTRIEYLMGIRAYNLRNFKENIEHAIGQRWFLGLFSPIFNAHLKSDGVSFSINSLESIKQNIKNY